MFKQLRNRLLLVNTIIISAMLLASFGVIFFVTWHNVEQQSANQLMASIQFERRGRDGGDPERRGMKQSESGEQPVPPENGGERMQPPEEMRQGGMREGNPQRMTAHFVVRTDSSGSVTDVRSPFEITDTSYEDSISKIIASVSRDGVIRYADGYWRYLREADGDGYVIGFINYTNEHKMLVTLLIVLILVWLAAVIGAFLISLKNANDSIRPVEESYNRQKQFVADASHELKTPLTTINTNVDVLLSHGSSTINEEKKWLGYIKSEAERMTKLTNDLLYLARLDHSDGEKAPEVRASLSEACDSVILTMEAVMFEKEILLEDEIDEGITAPASDSQLKQLVMILLDNAIKYTPKGGKVSITLKKQKDEAVLRVRNTGVGISEEDRKQIFERFYRADMSHARQDGEESGGYGLGLAIAKAICESCGGGISVESDGGSYTEFVVRI